MTSQLTELTTLTFEGPLFEDHGLEIDILHELIAYKRLLIETAKELWRKNNPDRTRLPHGFEDSITIKIFELGEGSTTVPLMREKQFPDGDLPLVKSDEIDQAVNLIEDGIEAISLDQPMPEHFPRTALHFFEEWGKSLGSENSIAMKSPTRNQPARYTAKEREIILSSVNGRYIDSVELIGEARSADLDGCKFTVRTEDGLKVPGNFDPQQESLITDALRDHESLRLRINGTAEFEYKNGKLIKLTEVKSLKLFPIDQPQIKFPEKPLWQALTEIGQQVSAELWDDIPSDLSKNLDQYLYGGKGDKE